MSNVSVNKLIGTKVTIKTLDKHGNILNSVTKKNEVTKEGVSVMARLLVDPSAPKPSHIYARFADIVGDAESDTNFNVALSDVTQLDFTIQTGNSATIGCLREPVFSSAKLEPNGDIADGKITFFFRLTSNSELVGTFTSASSKVFYLGLAAETNTGFPTEDLIFSVLDTGAGIEIPAAAQMAIDYELALTT